ncbi:MAG: carboxypeptidase-like regulatory domain-containing protein [Candidatus Methanoperedens sp.]|nr:carboxypeptidase-like regulatory domain-containing protein [Candidatus Methanoperedens nitroreducens]MDJ1420669.1 carboxypeptidase-like regulatory domain-containing protein [Candidatus Methanoperedens sp.]
MVAAYYISGYVTDSSTGMPLSNVNVTTNTSLVTSTDIFGFYNLTDIDNGTYLINTSLPGYSTSSSERVINSTDIDNANISLSPLLDPTYSISGYVFDNYGLGLGDVLVQNDSNKNTTIPSGYYLITSLPNGTYNFSYTKTGFDTGYLEVAVSGADNTSANKTIYDTTPPAQVTGLMNDTPTQTTVNLIWNSIADANYYQVFRDSTSLGYTQNTYWNDTELTPDTLYEYVIRANDSYNNRGQNSSILSVRTAQAADTTPPASVSNPSMITGNFFINNTWINPVGADFNYVWFRYSNDTTLQNVSNSTNYLNLTWSPHYTQSISAQTVDTSGNVNQTRIWFNATIPNNVPVQSHIENKVVDEGQLLTFTVSATDTDNDAITYGTNATNGIFNTTTGEFSWTPGYGDAGVYIWYFNSSDSFGGVASETITVTVNDIQLSITSSSPSSDPTTIQDTSQSFNITLSRTADIAWYMNGAQVQINTSITSASYTNSTAEVGTWNVTAIATDNIDIISRTWNWSVNAQPPTAYIPSDPTNLQDTTGNFWVNHTWQAGAGNLTDSYNISVNGIWANGTTSTYYNNGVGPHGWSNITVWAYNNSGSGSLSLNSISQNTQVANNVPIQESIGDKIIDENQLMQFTVSATDTDSDLITYGTNATKGTFNITTGELYWTPSYADAGVYIWYFNSSDGYGGITSETITVTVDDVPLSVIFSSPVSDPITTVGTAQTFEINLNRTADITWYIDGSAVQSNLSVISANYTDSIAGIGVYNVTAIASDSFDSASRTWNWTVIAQPTYNVSGYVFDNNGLGLGDVLVQNSISQNTTTESGYYLITGLLNGTYNFSFSKQGFDTGYLDVTINGADIINANKIIYDTTPPAQVTGLRNDTPTQTTVNLMWDQIPDANYYQVFRDSTSIGYTQNTYWSDTGLIADTLYQYQVRANDSYNNWGQNSSILSVKTAQAIDTAPPASVSNPSTTTGNFYINNTWINPEDTDFSYVWLRYSNDTTLQNVTKPTSYLNLTWSPHYTQNISAQTVDTSGNVNQTKVWFNATIPNNVPIQLPIGDRTVTEGDLLTFNVSATDTDSDTITYGTNATGGLLNPATGEYSWQTGSGDSGTYIWYFNSSDGYGGVATETITVIVNDVPLSIIFSSPVSDPVTTVGIEQTFEINLNRNADVTWYIDGSIVQTDLSVVSASYTNSTANIGMYNVTATASDSYDSVSRTWSWTVIAQPTYSVSGYVFDNYGSGLGDVLVQNDSYQNTTIASGYYLITGLLNGTYNLSFSKAGFDTGYFEVTVSGADIINANITIYDTTSPAQVTGLRNDTPTQTTVNLSWDPITDASYYQVFRSSTSIGYTQNTYWNDTGLIADTLYEYTVRANDSYNNWGQNSSILNVRTTPAADTTPPASVSNPYMMTGNFFINNTWVNPEDTDFSYVWFRYSNDTTLQNVSNPMNYLNLTWSPHYTQNISAQTVDTSGNVNQTKVWFNATIPNNVPIQAQIGDRTVTEGDLLTFNVSATDTDSDTITYGTNATRGSLNPTTGEYSWQTGIGDSGTYIWYFSSSDGYGGVASETITITVTASPPTEYIPPDPVNLASTQGNFWINYTWQAGAGNATDSYNINVNGIWTNGTNSTYYNNSVGPHGWSNITVWAYNNSGSGSLSLNSISQNTQVANNIPMQEPIGDKTIDENQYLQFTIIATDADSDLITYGTNATKGTFNITTGEFSWIPGYGDAGVYVWYFNSSDGSDGVASEIITVTVNDVPLLITVSSPANDTTTTVGTAQAFEIVLNRDADITWYINDSIIQSNLSVISADYTNSTAGAGVYNVTAIASDNYYSISRTWNWTVIDQTAPGGGGGGGEVRSYNISGYVLDSSNLKPLSIANVTTNTSLQTTTDLNGYYNFSGLINGSYMISAGLMGYADNYINRTISGADISYANITLSPLSCTDCHYSISYMNSFDRSDLYVNQTMINDSVHVALSCRDCHTDTSVHPPPKSGWKWCEDCHANTQNPRTDKGRHNIVSNPWNNLYNGVSVVNITSCTTCHDPALYNNSKDTYGKEKGIDCDYCHSFPDNVIEAFSITATLFLLILSNRYNND